MMDSLPPQLTYLKQRKWQKISEGESDADVFRIVGDETQYLKVSALDAQYSVQQDYARLDWLQGKIAVPRILDYVETRSHGFLLMSECTGLHPLHDNLAWSDEERIQALVKAASDFHAIAPDDCPYKQSFDAQIALAQHNIEQGNVRVDMWDEEHQGRTIADLLAEFVSLKPETEDWVVTHGDMYPINIRVDAISKQVTGFIDVGALAIADRYTDLAVIYQAIGWHLDAEWQARFFESYGVPLDRQKLRFYQLFQEFL